MTTATTETLLRERNFSFIETYTTDDGEVDVYADTASNQIRVTYDHEGMPTDINLCAPALNITEVVIMAPSGTRLGEDAREALLYELVDDSQLMFRMSGVKEDDPIPDMA